MIEPMWQAFLDQWFASLARASWHGAIAVALVWIVCRLAPRIPPAVRCWLWRLALVKMVLALIPLGSFDVPLLPASWSTPAPQVVANPLTSPGGAPRATSGDGVALSPSADNSKALTPANTPTLLAASPITQRMPWGLVALFALWLAVVAAFLFMLAKHTRAARRGRGHWRLIKDHDVLTLNEQLAGQLGLFQPPVLFESEACDTPVVFGAVRTSIVLPSSLVSDAAPAEMRLILAHEMAHVRRWDLLGNWLTTLVSAFFFFHPLVWLAVRESRLDEEMACDELALAQPDASAADYGRLLVDLATRFRRVDWPVATVGVVESFQVLLKRRLHALKTLPDRSRAVVALSRVLALAAVLGLLPWRLVAATPTDLDSASNPRVASRVTQWPKAADIASEPSYTERQTDVATQAGPMTIRVDRVRRHADGAFAMGIVPSGLHPAAAQSDVELTSYPRPPNLILDLQVSGPKNDESSHWICNVIGPLRAVDDLGHTVTAPEVLSLHRLQMRGVDYGRGDGLAAVHLRLPRESAAATELRSLEGTLVIAEGEVRRVTFEASDLARLTNRKPGRTPNHVEKHYRSNGGTLPIIMTDVEWAKDGLNVLLATNWISSPPNPEKSPKYVDRMMRRYNRMNLLLHDSAGRTHGVAFSTEPGNKGPTIAVCDGHLRLSMARWASSPAYPCALKRFSGNMLMHQFHFDPLPAGVEIESLECVITECRTPPRAVPFKLTNIPLPNEQLP